MRILVVGSYYDSWLPKLKPVEEMVGRCADYEVVSDLDLKPGYDISRFDGLVLSGSPQLLSKNELHAPYRSFLKQVEIPTLGICYGHQIIAHAFGARVFHGGEFIEGLFPVDVLYPEPLFTGMGASFSGWESHREHVDLNDLERCGFRLLADSATCKVEAIRHVSLPLFGVQSHIERSGDDGDRIMANFCRFVGEYRR
jgi:GMP synthase (glutamine-hydrolysing)